ncbi:MAG: Octaprenyl-diphosphate synthase [Verrucomicrobia bacterium ADurb.Bin345]|nr:MAG: Octaprenyl-diphosphate synthase [Verrucomicrobia bacterium ADurb.Bin345]
MKREDVSQRDEPLARQLDEVRKLMAGCVAETPLQKPLADCSNLFGNGKMLRARLVLRLGPATGASYSTLLRAASAVELIHAASLLHDDVIDGGFLRRGAPTFWVERGIPAAILTGDLLLFKAFELIMPVDDGELVQPLIRLTGEVVEAETEQELVVRATPSDWETCVRIARRKTGPLFAFAARAAARDDEQLRATLTEAGYRIGTAYQLSDDILDVNGDTASAGKTLGLDAAREKSTAARVEVPATVDSVGYVRTLCEESSALLADWPAVQDAWNTYMLHDFRPALDRNLGLIPA